MLPGFVSTQDFNFHAQEINGHFRIAYERETHGILFRGHHHRKISANAAPDKSSELLFVIAVMIQITFGNFNAGAKVA